MKFGDIVDLSDESVSHASVMIEDERRGNRVQWNEVHECTLYGAVTFGVDKGRVLDTKMGSSQLRV